MSQQAPRRTSIARFLTTLIVVWALVAAAGGGVLFVVACWCVREPPARPGELGSVLDEHRSRLSDLSVSHVPREAFDDRVMWLKSGCGSRWYASIFGTADYEALRTWGLENAESWSEGDAAAMRSYSTDGNLKVVWREGDRLLRLSGTGRSDRYELKVSKETGRFELSFGPHW